MDDPLFAAKVASLEIELMALEMTVLRVVVEGDRRDADRDPRRRC